MISAEKFESVNGYLPFCISDGEVGARHIAGKEVRQSERIEAYLIVSDAGTSPGSLGSVEHVFSERVPEVEFIHPALPDLTSKAELVLPRGVGNYVGELSGDLIAAFRWRDAHLLKPASGRSNDGDVRRPENGLSLNERVRALEQAHRFAVEAGVGIAEGLIKIVHTEQDLVGHPGCERGVEHQGVVLHVDGSFFEIVGQIRARHGEGGAGAERCSLAALSHEVMERKMVLIVEVVV